MTRNILTSAIIIIAMFTITARTSYAQAKLVNTNIKNHFPPEESPAFSYYNADLDKSLIFIGEIEVQKNIKHSSIGEIAAKYGAHYIKYSAEHSQLRATYNTKIDYDRGIQTTYQDGWFKVKTQFYKLYREPEGVLPKKNKEPEFNVELFYRSLSRGDIFNSSFVSKLENYYLNDESQVVKDPNFILENNVPLIYYYFNCIVDYIVPPPKKYYKKKDELEALREQNMATLDREIVLLRKLFEAGLDPNLRVENYEPSYYYDEPQNIFSICGDYRTMLVIIQRAIDEWDDYLNRYPKNKHPQHLMERELQLYFYKQLESLIIEYGNVVKGTSGTVTDNDGNVYNTVTIGTQTWMAENLKTTKYNDGTDIPSVTDAGTWAGLSTPGYCWYENNIANKTTYGALYNWYTVNAAKLCPTGWHVPTDAEFTTLTTYLGGERVAGGKLKEVGTTHWDSPNTGATNEKGFAALPGGVRRVNGTFYNIGEVVDWWSATEYDAGNAWDRYVGCNFNMLSISHSSKGLGFSVRCVRD